ncbi:MAG: 2OG-Fe(II) oxygenase [Casimicrobiaceae bacterium]
MNERATEVANRDSAGAAARIEAIEWSNVAIELDLQGSAVLEGLVSHDECDALAEHYALDKPFRSRVVMQRHGFGRGEYKYFDYPLPPLVAQLRRSLYPKLVPIANDWHQALGNTVRFPAQHAAFIERCHGAGQVLPTPLLLPLRYVVGDYNCLHQDLYGEHVFPPQVIVLLSEPGRDFEGGELVMTEQRPRMQSRAHVLALRQGDAAVIAVSHKPLRGTRGVYRVNLRHGVSRVRSGSRHTAGIIFHDAR